MIPAAVAARILPSASALAATEETVGGSNETEASDEALVAEARAGDARAFERLLLRHEGLVLRVLRLLGVAGADREDVAQEVFVRVFRHLNGFRSGQPFSNWLYRIAVNATYDHRRRQARQRRGETGLPVEVEPRDTAPGPAEVMDRDELRRRLELALGELSERERAVFVLCELEGLSTKGVGRALGITAITVRRHLGRARARLQRQLAPRDREDPGQG